MKCPVCDCSCGTSDDPIYSESGSIVDFGECPHCLGTGEIQAGDWWMCVQGGLEMPLYFDGGGFLPHKNADSAYWCNFSPMYRIVRAK